MGATPEQIPGADDWVRLRGDHALAVYIDLKSPYAYLAIDPARDMARALGIEIEWRPFTLDIPSYLVRSGDEIEVRGKEKLKKKVTDAIEMNKGRPLPAWLEAQPTQLKGKIVQLPKREDVSSEINEQLIIELCSK